MSVGPKEIEACLTVLSALVEDRAALAKVDLETRNALLTAAGRLSRPERNEQRLLARALRRQRKHQTRDADERTLARAGIRELREQPVFITPSPALLEATTLPPDDRELLDPRICYVCKEPFSRVHFFYDQLCGPCGDFNFEKRGQTADLRGRVALITGARVKIGYQAAILLLRAGARVIVSTRFPKDAAARYAREPDFESFARRLVIHGLDLRHTPSVEAFVRHLEHTESRLDFVLHNACQTVRRPAGFYEHLMVRERAPLGSLPEAERGVLSEYDAFVASSGPALAGSPAEPAAHSAAELSQLPVSPEDSRASRALFPAGRLDADLQQVDLRDINSWRLALHQVSTVELLEVQLVNAIAPFVLNARLKPLMLRQPSRDKHIVNVSAMEGQFYRRFKTDKHPHTNMAKAALNMMTRTSASDYARDGIHMNSVDTGWVTDEDPAHIAIRKTRENGFQPPLDIVDGAARIVDPIFHGFNTGEHRYGLFLKDYRPAPW